mmetsp:Transcript_7033/g.25020  ORF Transcript_7033/g.25020 Transcript_7033/m.25020 type:complete len:179 (-) Transcript_7033:118-654(-)
MWGIYLSESAANVFGNIYPAYMSYKAILSGRPEQHRQWLMFWIVSTCFTILEMFGDALVSWLPLYYEAKIACLVWLALPRFKGATTIYTNYVGPLLDTYEADIDGGLDAVRAKVGEKVGELRRGGVKVLREKAGEIAQLTGRMMAAAAEETRERAAAEGEGDDGDADDGSAESKRKDE